ncbi:putative Protein-lysine N-methyltransferase EEF2KMT [Hypsibius exemplaris]|uniref:C2H2-type domain-containing protein n=1 Tax=Hypsibius exemplaris TaxID=2072580 RepID=A0A9X6RMB4_HYPEX|nr:putative Protein-lysine N-methyltransferase EEF2KMT [Hypsibius exemplaris]
MATPDKSRGALWNLQRGYFAMVSLKQLEGLLRAALADYTPEDYAKEFAESQSFNGLVLQESILRATVLKSFSRKPPAGYRKKFLRVFVEEVEALEWEVFEEVWLVSSACCQEDSAKTSASIDDAGKTYFLDDDGSRYVSIPYEPFVIANGTTGLSAWDAGFYLVEWLTMHPELVRRKCVVELGSGSGLSGLLICKLFTPSSYTFTDHREDILERIRRNISLNGLQGIPSQSVDVMELDWFCSSEQDAERWKDTDVLLAADVLYDPDLFKPFLLTLNVLTANRGSQVAILLAVKIRTEETFRKFQITAESMGWVLEDISAPDAIGKVFPAGSMSSTPTVSTSSPESNRRTDHLLVDIVVAPAEILASNAQRPRCSSCRQSFRDHGACRAHEFLQHSFFNSGCSNKSDSSPTSSTASTTTGQPVLCRQEIRYYCPAEGCRYALPAQSGVVGCADSTRKYFREMRYLKEHYLRQHSEQTFKCNGCGVKCRSDRELRLHRSSCQTSVCVCGKSMKSRQAFSHHAKICEKYLSSTGRQSLSPEKQNSGLKRTWTDSRSLLPVKTIKPKPPRLTCMSGAVAGRSVKPSNTLFVNSCVQTTDTRLTRPKNADASTGALCSSYPSRPMTANRNPQCQQVQAGGEYCDLLSEIRSSGVQTIALLVKPVPGLQIDTYTQTEQFAEHDGFSSQDASALFQYLDARDGGRSQGIQTQTIESELVPFYLPANSTTETQTFDDYYNYPPGSSSGLFSPSYSTETLGTQTSLYVDGLIDEFVQQESVDMQTQTLVQMDDCLVWDFSDADTQTSGLRDLLRMSEF